MPNDVCLVQSSDPVNFSLMAYRKVGGRRSGPAVHDPGHPLADKELVADRSLAVRPARGPALAARFPISSSMSSFAASATLFVK
jgi:hypothetical protein